MTWEKPEQVVLCVIEKITNKVVLLSWISNTAKVKDNLQWYFNGS